jgi:hypothetical protein
MQTKLNAAKQEFSKLRTQDGESDRIRVLELLLQLHSEGLDPNDAGWVLWNTCDLYALAHEPATQHRYQSEFFDLVKLNFPERAHWVVCDGTQANWQIRGGFFDFWLRCYHFANDNAPCTAENRGPRFEAHRANAYSFAEFDEMSHAEAALDAMAELLEEDLEWPNQPFASATYQTLRMEFCAATGQSDKVEKAAEDLEITLDDWLQNPGSAATALPEEKPLFGSWQSFVAYRSPVNMLSVSLYNTACTFAKIGRFAAAERLFRAWMDYRGRALMDYGRCMFLKSCWHNRHSRDEIIGLLRESDVISAEYLIHVVPEMADVVGN